MLSVNTETHIISICSALGTYEVNEMGESEFVSGDEVIGNYYRTYKIY